MLAHRDGLAAADLAAELGLDPGYLSRILKSFGKRGLIGRKRGASDRRRSTLAVTAAVQVSAGCRVRKV